MWTLEQAATKLQTMSQREEADFIAVNRGQTLVMACSGVRLG